MIPSRLCVLALCAVLAACGGEKPPEPPKLARAMPHIPLPPSPTFVQRSGGADVVQIVLKSQATPERVVAYYRNVFRQGKWRLVNEAKDQEGATVMLANEDGPPLWVRIRPAPGGTLVELSGAVVAKADSARTQPATQPAAPKPAS